ncbi:hypothetical protein [Pantoea cypripedii]|uniref:hypothetical protein n=1 Tax=Pantoea cypripedii TaxID=55209 RepID=UPI001301BC29|nr:hypothetical protein [Pantoea cypripedii]MBP2199257.1 hypothetical protein [Pantoea cypripedii]
MFTPPEDAHLLMMRSPQETVIVRMLDGWPLAAAIPGAGYLAVLSGIPVSRPCF